MKVKSESEVAQSCPTLRDPMDHSLPGSSIHGVFQARVLEWGAIAFSVCHLSDFLKYASDYLTLLHKWPLPSPLHMFQTIWASQVVVLLLLLLSRFSRV